MNSRVLVSEQRNYKVLTVENAKNIVTNYMEQNSLTHHNINFGLPEINDRYHIWTVPTLYYDNFTLGNIAIDAKTGHINENQSSEISLLKKRIQSFNKYKLKTKDEVIDNIKKYLDKELLSNEVILKPSSIKLLKNESNEYQWVVSLYNKYEYLMGKIYLSPMDGKIDTNGSSSSEILLRRVNEKSISNKKKIYDVSPLQNLVIRGDSAKVLKKLPSQSIDMIFTSPPYYNAKKHYSEYTNYNEYLEIIKNVIKACKRVLIDGKFFIMNTSHVLVPRVKRSESSSRIAVPFDIHRLFIEEGFEFVDDIIWQKPEGAGWASGRGRRFSADRNAMQYKAVPVTEYVMVYRKKSDKLIDYFIRNHPNQNLVEDSKIKGNYDVTNIWYISPGRDKRHPAIFPQELAEKVIKYYSFKNDVILDPFAGLGTTAKAAIELERRFCMVELNEKYIEFLKSDLKKVYKNIEFDYKNYEDN